MEKEKKIAIVLFVLAIVFVIIGSTFAYWTWQSSVNDKTNVTFTVTSGFSCGADGGGSITSQQKSLAPTSCTNTTYAFQRTIVTNVTNSRSGSVYMDLWLDVNTIGSGLTNSQNFKYALTSQANNCTSNVIRTGTFNGITNGGKVYLLRGDEYQQTGTNTYYLYVWLDAAETSSSTQNQTFDISLGGTCIDNSPWVYTVNLYDENVTNNNSVTIGQAIPNTITQYQTPAAAMAAFSNRPFYLKHTVGDFSRWCIIMNNDTSNCLYSAPTETDCNTVLSQGAPDDGNTYTCSNITASNAVTESYVGFVVTPAMAAANPGMVAGTYYLRGLDTYDVTGYCKNQYYDSNTGNCVSPYYESNKTVLQSAFGSNYCNDDSSLSLFVCGVSGLTVDAYLGGTVEAYVGVEARCYVDDFGTSNCDG